MALVALLAASLPFVVEGHFGILGTSFNPDMSQHLLATARLAEGNASQLLHQGYPLGPHSIVVALNKGLGIGLVQGFSGLSVAVLVLAPLTALAAFADGCSALLGAAAALVVGRAYVVASYFAQGAFKETLEALFVLAFALSLRETIHASLADPPAALRPSRPYRRRRRLRLQLPGPPLADRHLPRSGSAVSRRAPSGCRVGPGADVPSARRNRRRPRCPPDPARVCSLFAVLVAPEIGRMIDFHSFETFDPNGPGLGNLFGQVSPFEALGIWPSGDFRLAPGDGAVPAAAYYLGAAFGLVLLALRASPAAGAAARRAVLAGARRPPPSPTPPPASAARPTPPPRRSRSAPRSSR